MFSGLLDHTWSSRFLQPNFLNYLVETQFLSSSSRVNTAVWMHYMDANETGEEKAWWQLHKNAASNTEQVLDATLHKAAAIQPPTTHHENYHS